MVEKFSVQETYAKQSRCFGCGPSNNEGLQIKSFLDGAELKAEWRAKPHHEAFPSMLNGGIVGALLDCHCNWMAAIKLMAERAEATPPCTVTSEYSIKLLRPTPSTETLYLWASVVFVEGSKVVVEGTLSTADKVTATCRGTFVAVKEGHPAFHRW